MSEGASTFYNAVMVSRSPRDEVHGILPREDSNAFEDFRGNPRLSTPPSVGVSKILRVIDLVSFMARFNSSTYCLTIHNLLFDLIKDLFFSCASQYLLLLLLYAECEYIYFISSTGSLKKGLATEKNRFTKGCGGQ